LPGKYTISLGTFRKLEKISNLPVLLVVDGGAGRRWVMLCLRAFLFLLPTTGSVDFCSGDGIFICGGNDTTLSMLNTANKQE